MVISVGLFQLAIGMRPVCLALVQRAAFGILQIGFRGWQGGTSAFQASRYFAAAINNIIYCTWIELRLDQILTYPPTVAACPGTGRAHTGQDA